MVSVYESSDTSRKGPPRTRWPPEGELIPASPILHSWGAQIPDRLSVMTAVTVMVCGPVEVSICVGDTERDTSVGGCVSDWAEAGAAVATSTTRLASARTTCERIVMPCPFGSPRDVAAQSSWVAGARQWALTLVGKAPYPL